MPATRPAALLVALSVNLQLAYSPLRLEELAALKEFYNATGGASWQTNTNWDLAANSQCGFVDNAVGPDWPYVAPALEQTTAPGCIYKDPCITATKWHGVGCIDPCYEPTDGPNCVFGRVTLLDLNRNNVVGTIPESLFDNLINITYLDLSYNSLSGTIPTETGKLRNVQGVHLENNAFVGTLPTEIAYLGSSLGYGLDNHGYLTGLTALSVSHNNLTGTIPSEIAFLENLQHFDVSSNPSFGYPQPETGEGNLRLNPGLPSEIGMLTYLQNLNLDHCGFQGTIPPQIGDLSSLRTFNAHGTFAHATIEGTNQFSGTLPPEVGKLHILEDLGLGDNFMSGTIPPQIGKLTRMQRFEMGNNMLSGTMPDAFSGLSKLEYWDTYGNMIIGDLPPSIEYAKAIRHLYVQIEQTDVLRNHLCNERIPGMGNRFSVVGAPDYYPGLKMNMAIQANDYYRMKHVSACANPLSPEDAFYPLSGDV